MDIEPCSMKSNLSTETLTQEILTADLRKTEFDYEEKSNQL